MITTSKGIRYAFFYMITYLKPKKIVKKPQILGSVTIFSYICSRIYKQIGETLSGIIKM